jgi:predicted XRE-type DNA-binding protein
MGKKRAKLSEQIRQAVNDSGLVRADICRALKIDEGLFSRFMNGKGGLAMANLDALADLLKLGPIPKAARPKRKAR